MGREEYFQSAVLIPLLKRDSQWELLFQIRAAEIRQGDEICFPGGGFDPVLDRDFLDTALRETGEELGIDRGKIDIIGPMDTLITPMDVLVEPFLAVLKIQSLEELVPNPAEVASVFTLPLDKLKTIPRENYQVRTEMHAFSIDSDTGEENLHFPGSSLGLPERYHRSWGNKMHNILVYPTEYGAIWGITARIVKDFITLLDE